MALEGMKTNERDKKVKATPDSDQYKIALKLVNLILVNIGNTEIEVLTDFVNVDREDIIKDVNKVSLIGMENELFPLFNKKDSGYYRKTGNAFVLNCLRGLMKEMGYELFFEQKDVHNQINDKRFRKTCSYYSIK